MITLEDCEWWNHTTLLRPDHDGRITIRRIREVAHALPLSYLPASRGLFMRHGRHLSVCKYRTSFIGDYQADSIRAWGVVIKPPTDKGRYFFLPYEHHDSIMGTIIDCSENIAPSGLGATCLSCLLSEGWKVISSQDISPGDTYGRAHDCPLFYQIEEAELGYLPLQDQLAWAMSAGNWPDSTSLEGKVSPPSEERFAWVHSSNYIIQLEDCMWKPYSRYLGKGDPLRISSSSLSGYESIIDEHFQVAAKKILCYGRNMAKTAFPIRRLYWIRISSGSGGKDVVTGVLLRPPFSPHKRIFFLYDFDGDGTMIYDFYKGHAGVICLSLLFQEGWVPDFNPNSYPGAIET